MQFCKPHWDALRAAVDAKGMSQLVARSGEKAMEDIKTQLEGTSTLENWDPLMASYWAISGKVLERVGLGAMPEDFCPLCSVQDSFDHISKLPGYNPDYHHDAAEWIDSCTTGMQKYARSNGLIPDVQ